MKPHPYLRAPDRARAFEHLSANPSGDTRTWAEELGWKRGKLLRFLDGVRRYQLADIETSRFGSRFRPCAGAINSSGPKADQNATGAGPWSDRSATTLGSAGVTRVTGPSERKAKRPSVSHTAGDAVPWSSIAVRMIPVMNEEFSRLLGEAYRQILPDNRGSHRAGHQLEAAHVDPDWCEQRLRLLCRTFNPSKHGGGQAPRTLAYFTTGLIRDWRQYTLPLLARVATSTPAPAPAAPPPTAVELLPDPAPAADPTRWRREISLERKDLSRIGADDVRRASGG